MAANIAPAASAASVPATQKSLALKMSDNNLRMPVLGNVDAGKSTLIGTLQTMILDNGRGSNRSFIMRQQHEVRTGRTSTAHSHLVGFDEDGNIVQQSTKGKTDAAVVSKASRVITMFDLPGHEAYLNTAIHGIAKSVCDYAMICVNAKQSPTRVTKRHFSICAALGIPVVVVLTKIDDCPEHVFKNTVDEVCAIVRSKDVGKKPFKIKEEADLENVVENLHVLTPIVPVSSVTGEGLPLLSKLLFTVPKRRRHKEKVQRPFELMVEDIFNVTGVGVVVHGLVNAGQWKKGEPVYVGPASDGNFIKTTVKSAEIARTQVDSTWAGHSVCFALALTKDQRRKLRVGMVVIKSPVRVPRTFTAHITALKGRAPTITEGKTQIMVHVLHVRQNARILEIRIADSNGTCDAVLACGKRAVMKFEFPHRPEYVRKGMRVIIREDGFTGVGVIKETQS